MWFPLALRIVAAALALVMISGAATLDRACCLFAESDVATCCEPRGETGPTVEKPPCCDESVATDVSADRAERHALDSVELVAIEIALTQLSSDVPETTFGSRGRALPDDTPRYRATCRLLL